MGTEKVDLLYADGILQKYVSRTEIDKKTMLPKRYDEIMESIEIQEPSEKFPMGVVFVKLKTNNIES